MDRSTRALSMAEDVAAAAENLRSTVKSKTRIAVKYGRFENGVTKYGPFRSDGTAAVIVRFGNQPQYLKFGDQILDYGYSPLFGVIPEGEGIISVTDTSDYPSLISFGGTWL